MSNRTRRIRRAAVAALVGGGMIIGVGAGTASAAGHEENCEMAQGTPFQALCDQFDELDDGDGDGDGDGGGAQDLIDGCRELLEEGVNEGFGELCDFFEDTFGGDNGPDPDPDPGDGTGGTDDTDFTPPATDPPATGTPTGGDTAAAGARSLPDTGGTGTTTVLLAGGALAAGALALRRFVTG